MTKEGLKWKNNDVEDSTALGNKTDGEAASEDVIMFLSAETELSKQEMLLLLGCEERSGF